MRIEAKKSVCNLIFNNLCVSVMIEPGKCILYIYAISFFTVCVSVLVLTEVLIFYSLCVCFSAD